MLVLGRLLRSNRSYSGYLILSDQITKTKHRQMNKTFPKLAVELFYLVRLVITFLSFLWTLSFSSTSPLPRALRVQNTLSTICRRMSAEKDEPHAKRQGKQEFVLKTVPILPSPINIQKNATNSQKKKKKKKKSEKK